jgi:hypothetical protein
MATKILRKHQNAMHSALFMLKFDILKGRLVALFQMQNNS